MYFAVAIIEVASRLAIEVNKFGGNFPFKTSFAVAKVEEELSLWITIDSLGSRVKTPIRLLSQYNIF